jgi:hypothetical protein
MSGFVATTATSTPPPISSGDFWPAIDPADMRAVQRVDGTITDARLIACLRLAMASVEDELECWQQQQLALGRDTLADVPAKTIDGTSRLVLLYQRAVYATAKAELIERYADYDATADGKRRADDMACAIDDHRRYARYAIRDILGRPRHTVELM